MLLEHDARQVIYQAITATPGIDVKTGLTGTDRHQWITLRYHVDRLASTGRTVQSLYRTGVVPVSCNQGAYGSGAGGPGISGGPILPAGSSGCSTGTGLTRQHLADALAIFGPSVAGRWTT